MRNDKSISHPNNPNCMDILIVDDEKSIRLTTSLALEAEGHYVETAEDGPLADSKSHPRGWGSFPRILGKYVRDEHLLTLEEAIRKMTSRPATRVGLSDRGILRSGLMADITVFDAATIRDVATFDNPNRYSTGVKWVFVNGRAVVANGAITAARPGRGLRGPGYRK